ncbi:hypothetical protein ACHHYP_20606 [Achlya hypogyna]|uniref:DDE-1 domain-containing protein n=1 Tax=Achlya hypogyna TaxID=1202772 RepID=A0A1V9YHA9_ACHHY|nr:hypothetical protein ACHHYP_20606 [Achlya hypogyna]
MIEFIKYEEQPWLQEYLSTRSEDSLQRLLRNFAYRYGFSRKRAISKQLSESDLESKKAAFAADFWACFYDVPPALILNADETGKFLDSPPRTELEPGSVLLVDNFKAHVSDTSYEVMWNQVQSELVALPPNCTSVCQPLDVGVMGPFKAKLRRMWMKDLNIYNTPKEKRLATIQRAILA